MTLPVLFLRDPTESRFRLHSVPEYVLGGEKSTSKAARKTPQWYRMYARFTAEELVYYCRAGLKQQTDCP